jgi:predicted nucleic acid-binding protein
LILVDTSAWIEFLRDTRSPVAKAVDELIGGDLASTDMIRMELLCGARDESHLQDLRRLAASTTCFPTEPPDYDQAALLYRRCRESGETIRSLTDCLIAAVAVRWDLPVLQKDRDFEVLAAVAGVRLAESAFR